MKRFFRLALLAAVAALAVFCASPQQMAKLASMVKTECNPHTLECVGGRIAATYTISFPAKYFLPNAYMKITLELVYENQKEVAPDFWMQGEKIRDNYAVVPYKTASTVKRDVVFPYKKGRSFYTVNQFLFIYKYFCRIFI